MPFVKINNNILNYAWLNYHRKQTLVFINSLGTNFQIWNEMVPLLSDKFNILLHDKRGHGLSTFSNSQNPLIDDYADDIIGLMDYCGISVAHLVGLSIGGLITYSFTERYPHRCDKLVFCDTGSKIGTKENWNERIVNIEAKGIASISDMVMRKWLSAKFLEGKPDQVKGYAYMFEQTSQIGYSNACNAISKADYSKEAQNIKKRTLFVVGSEDVATIPDYVKENAQQVQGSKFYKFKGAGHLPCIEVPVEFAHQLKKFIL